MKESSIGKALFRYWPYLVFIVSAGIYNYFFLGDGYCFVGDEGYLQSLGARIVDGEKPYLDFYFQRTALSIYLQALYILIFGSSYTLLIGRVLWVLQTVLVAILISKIFEDKVKKWELLLFLFLSYITVSMLFSFQWYNYDAVFFAILTLFLLHKKQYYLSGSAAFLAGMAKQNYFLMLPMLFFIALAFHFFKKEHGLISFKSIGKMALGLAVPVVAYIVYLGVDGRLGLFYENVFVLPGQINKLSMSFILFQNHSEAFFKALPLIIPFAIMIIPPGKRIIWAIIGTVVFVFVFNRYFNETYNYVYFLVFFNYLLLILCLFQINLNGGQPPDDGIRKEIIVIYILALIIQYVSGFNYSGLRFSSMGAASVLPISYYIIKQTNYANARRILIVMTFAGLTVMGIYHKYNYMYWDGPRSEMTESFEHRKLAGIRSSTKNTENLDRIISAVETHTQVGDYIFAFPDLPSIYYITDRKNPAPIGWFYWAEFNNDMLVESIDIMKTRPPKMIITGPRPLLEPVFSFVSRNYIQLDSFDGFGIYLLKSG